MERYKIVVALLLVVAAVFLFKPELLGLGKDDGTTPLSIAPTTDMVPLETGLTCDSDQGCYEALQAQGAPEDVNFACIENQCIVYTQQILGGGDFND